MSFNVTQCPACESTFNTNSRVLAVAAGKVRCGACLTVFEAIDNFVVSDTDESDATQDESVFVGNNPQEYFDPSRFLTRSALTETQPTSSDLDDPITEQFLHEDLEQSETVDEQFFNTVADQLLGSNEPASSDFSEPEAVAAEPAQKLLEHKPDETIDDAFEDEFLGSFSSEPQALIEVESESEIEEGTEIKAEIGEEATDAAEEQTAEPDPLSPEQAHDDSLQEAQAIDATSLSEELPQESPPEPKDTTVGLELSVSFSFGHMPAPKTTEEESAPLEEPLEEATEPSQETTSDLESEPKIETEPDPALEAASESEFESEFKSEIDVETFSQSEQGEDIFLSSIAEELEQGSQADSEWPPSKHETEALELPDDLTEILESPADAEAEAAEAPDSVINAEADSEIYELWDFPEDTPSAEPIDGEPPEATAAGQTDEVFESEAPQQDEAEELEESTESIRARALETELNDEDALEAIPKENLAALGAMSSPLELLAGKESRLLRSSLLAICILLLGGLLSGQYLWQRMELYSQLPQLRAIYESACAATGCELPEFSDIGAVRSENLTVQTHPSFENGLMVNTIIRNTAAFEQPFPILILSFNSATNSTIALREFSAAEYLDPGLRSVQAMPPNTPVQISLAIMDPGPQAVNYTLAFRLP